MHAHFANSFSIIPARTLAASALLASIAGADVLYGVRGDQLVRIDTDTATATLSGSIGTDPIDGLAFGNDGSLYGVARASACPTLSFRSLVELDASTGAGTTLMGLHVTEGCSAGAAFDALWNRVVFVVESSGSAPMLYHAWVKNLGTQSYLSTLKYSNGQPFDGALAALQYDAQHTLFGLDVAAGHEELVSIDEFTGVVTPIGSHGLAGFAELGALAIGPTGSFWSIETTASAYRLIVIDPVTGAASLGATVRGLTPGSPIVELASYSVPAPWLYGSSKTHSAGCAGSMGWSGVPSTSAGSGFDVRATSMLNVKLGLLFYGQNGPASIQAPAGTLNVNPPFRRTPPQSAGGTTPPALDCSGELHFDFNAYVASGADPSLVPGVSIWCQYWQRDPLSQPASSVLTDALFFVLPPP